MASLKSRRARVVLISLLVVVSLLWLARRDAPRPPEAPLPPAVLAEGAPPGPHPPKTSQNLGAQFMQSLWATGHRDSSNTDFVPMNLSSEFEMERHVLRGHPIFWAPTIGVDGTLYVTTGSPAGESHLFALTPAGEVLWSADPQESLADLDSFAIINAPTLDHEGNLYVGDRNQLWSFSPTGEVRWVTELAPHGVEWGFMTVMLSQRGSVGGVTTEGKVLFFDMRTGELAAPMLELPGQRGPDAEDAPPESLWQGLMDPEIIPFIFNLIQGWEMEVANTPALHPVTGRLYATAAGRTPGSGVLYGIDILEDSIEVAFEAPMGGGSGTAPAISHDGRRVYAVDERGRMVAIDAHTGRRLWQSDPGGGGSASPSVGRDETIYSPSEDHIVAYTPDGAVRWNVSYDALCRERLPDAGGVWGLLLSEPAAFVNSLLTIGEDHGWMNIVCGYHLPSFMSKSDRTRVPIPQESLFVTFDLRDGSVVGSPRLLPESSEGFVTPIPGGRVAVTTSGAIPSIFYNMVNPILPEELKVDGPPEAGLLLLRRSASP